MPATIPNNNRLPKFFQHRLGKTNRSYYQTSKYTVNLPSEILSTLFTQHLVLEEREMDTEGHLACKNLSGVVLA